MPLTNFFRQIQRHYLHFLLNNMCHYLFTLLSMWSDWYVFRKFQQIIGGGSLGIKKKKKGNNILIFILEDMLKVTSSSPMLCYIEEYDGLIIVCSNDLLFDIFWYDEFIITLNVHNDTRILSHLIFKI